MNETMQTRTILDDIGPRDAAVVTVACDTGLKYLAGTSTEESTSETLAAPRGLTASDTDREV